MTAVPPDSSRRVGLTLGKFAPFHRGHQHVVETALAEVDHLVVVVYDAPDTTSVPLSVRADWIRECHPTVEVIEGWTLPTGTGYDDDTKQRHEEALRGLLAEHGIEDVDAFYSSEPYGAHVSAALDADDRRVDESRDVVPISGTAIRADPYEHRDFVPDRVYRDLVTNVVFLGGPSTGKTTLARALAAEYDTEWMPEYGREYWERRQVDRRLTREQLVEIADGHREREDALLATSDEYLFTDTNAITTLLFSRRYHGDALPRLERLARRCASRYDLVFVCGTDVPYDDTWDREGEAWRERMQKQTVAYLSRHNVPYVRVTGDLDDRIATVRAVLDAYEPYDLQRPAPTGSRG